MRSAFGFYPVQLSVLVIAIYGMVIFLATSAQLQQAPTVVAEVPGIHEAWRDLQEISRGFHPYNSHANDVVHDYIVNQVKQVAAKSVRHVEVDAKVSPVMYSSADVFDASVPKGKVSYFEANNVLVKVAGNNDSLGAVLISSHFDSVPTSHGTTDDGVGIASMLGILRYLLSQDELSLERTIIFNFNNDEEFGLRGAEAFVLHDWWKQVEAFVNLEGMGAGGRSLLFRTTDYGVGQHYKAARSPHGNSAIQQGFEITSAVRSETDYRVYTREGARGLDIAFYKPRTLYHTRRDSISGSNINALAHMMGNALDTLISLANADSYGDHSEPPVYFDLFGRYFFIYTLNVLRIWNVVGVVAGPVVLAGLLTVSIKVGRFDSSLRGWGRLPLSLLVSCSLVATGIYYTKVYNPYIYFSNLSISLWTYIAGFVIINYVFLKVAAYIRPVDDQKLIIFVELFVILWITMLKCTVDSYNGLGGEYFITVLYYSILSCGVVGLLGHLVEGHRGQDREYEVINVDEPEEQTENSPLLEHEHAELPPSDDGKFLDFDWLIQLVIAVPVSLALIYTVGFLLLDGLRTALADSTAQLKLFSTLLGSTVVFVGLVLLPFIDKLHPVVVLFLFIFSLYGARTMTYFPFTIEAPLKLRSVQTINLDTSPPELFAWSSGLAGYNQKVVQDVPGVQGLNCSISPLSGIEICKYQAPRPWLLDHKPNFDDWFNVQITQHRSGSDPFQSNVDIYAPNSRSCLISFSTESFKSRDPHGKYPSPVRRVTVFHGNNTADGSLLPYSPGWHHSEEFDSYHSLDGIDDFSFIQLDWKTQTYHIQFEWIPWVGETIDDDLTVEVQCHWSEYDRVSYVNGEVHRLLPAYDDLLEYSPDYITWANQEEGLLKIRKSVVL